MADYVGQNCDDWVIVKKELLRAVDNNTRDLFSIRNPNSKKHLLNDFEKEVMEYWKTLTNVELSLSDTKLHDVEYVYNTKGWGLQKFNKERTERRGAQTSR